MRLNQLRDTAIAGLLGAALLLGSPGTSSAEPGKGKGHGKGWRERGEKRVERKVERSNGKSKAFRSVERNAKSRSSANRSSSRTSEERVVRGSTRRSEDRVVRTRGDRVIRSREVSDRDYAYRAPSRTRVQTSYTAPRWTGGRYYTGARYHTVYRGYPVYREYVSYRYAPAYAPAYGWRYYCAPRYVYDTHVVYVQPVRFFVAADFMIGGVGISARYVDPGPVYGCNFCDARFGTYHAYETHVEHACGHIPHGYRVYADDWHDEVWDQGHDEYGYGYGDDYDHDEDYYDE